MSDYYTPFERNLEEPREPGPIVAYDFETDLIPQDEDGSVSPRYFTAHGAGLRVSKRLAYYEDIAGLFDYLWPMLEPRTRLAAWNGNRFDTRIILEALVYHDTRYTIRPFLSKANAIRGCLIKRGRKSVYLLDGMAMLGLQCSLAELLAVFVPELPKLDIGLKRGEQFDADNPEHVKYAERDAEGLYLALTRAEKLMRGITGLPLQVTIGGLGIRAFERRIPRNVRIFANGGGLDTLIREKVMRGGYVVSRKYRGPAWSYDINQAYASAMRECWLPAGKPARTLEFVRGLPGVYRCVISREPLALVPYIVKDYESGQSVEAFGDELPTMLCSNEIACLRRHGWKVEVLDGYVWSERFRMRHFVNVLERLRAQHASGTPINLLCKAVGNNAYGKTVEREVRGEYIFAAKPPKNAVAVQRDDLEYESNIWFRTSNADGRRRYHRPHIGAFITAHVRCQLYDAIMTDPEHFIKADTDSVTFSRANAALPIHKTTYGKWKLESDGAEHIVIAKKVYWQPDKTVAKGLHTRELSREHYERWFHGDVPSQKQTQLQSWRVALKPTWRVRDRKGTRVA